MAPETTQEIFTTPLDEWMKRKELTEVKVETPSLSPHLQDENNTRDLGAECQGCIIPVGSITIKEESL